MRIHQNTRVVPTALHSTLLTVRSLFQCFSNLLQDGNSRNMNVIKTTKRDWTCRIYDDAASDTEVHDSQADVYTEQ